MDTVEPHNGSQHTYFAAIAIVALLALAYVAALVLKPELFGGRQPTGTPGGEPESNHGQRARIAEEIQTIRRDVAQIRAEVGEVKSGLSAHEEREKTMLSRIGRVEQAVGQAGPQRLASSGLAPASPVPSTSAPTPPPLAGQPAGGAMVTGIIEDGKAAAKSAPVATTPGVPSAPPGSKAPLPKTASISAPAAPPPTTAPPGMSSSIVSSILPPMAAPIPASPAASPVAGKATPSGVQLASGPSLDALRLSWSLLVERHRSVLKGLEPRYVSPEGAPDVFNLVAGPLGAPEDASKVCASLKTRRISCTVVPFAGQGL